MNENRKKISSVNKFRFLAAAALSAAILGSQIPVVQASETGVIQETSNIIPENVTVEYPVALADIKLPDNEYGTLEWADGSFVPDRRVQSCEAILKPAEGVDLSDMEGWDKEAGGVICYIKVVVSSMESSEDYESEDELAEKNTSENTEVQEEINSFVTEVSENEEVISEEAEQTDEVSGEIGEEQTADEQAEEQTADENTDKSGEESVQDTETEPSQEETEDVISDAEEKEAVLEEKAEQKPENQKPEDQKEEENTGHSQSEQDEEIAEPSEEQNELPENIFDNPVDFTVEDDRPDQAEENLTEEEQAQQAILNHSCNGISVSGINLPWYVQFRVSSGESYEFSNESDAMIFQSYEFELWDLQNNTEYEIPDGEYISVTIPVKEGYDYIIEHLLDNGATETIIPSVEGSTMIFSTHSFSPFGIAGSKQLVGPDFEPDISVSPTPTPTVTPAAKPSQTPGGSTGSSTGNSNSSSGSSASTSGGTAMNNSGSSSGSDGSNSGNSQTYSSADSNSAGGSESLSAGSSNSGSVQSTGNQSTTKNNAVATGDTTMILPFVILVMAAVLIIGAVLFIKKKKK